MVIMYYMINEMKDEINYEINNQMLDEVNGQMLNEIVLNI